MSSDDNIEELRGWLLDNKNIVRLFNKQRQYLREQQVRIDTVEKMNINDPMVKLFSKQAKNYAHDMEALTDWLEIAYLNIAELYDHVILLSKKFLEGDKKYASMHNEVTNAVNELESIKEKKPALDWIDNYFRKASETTPE
jgi:hypothetical protein